MHVRCTVRVKIAAGTVCMIQKLCSATSNPSTHSTGFTCGQYKTLQVFSPTGLSNQPPKSTQTCFRAGFPSRLVTRCHRAGAFLPLQLPEPSCHVSSL